jgi:Flp pilus assembly protein TadD
LRAYSAVAELLATDPEAHRALATILKQQGDLDAADQAFETAAELDSLIR